MSRFQTNRVERTHDTGPTRPTRPARNLSHLADRVFGVPLMVHPNKLRVVLESIGSRLDPLGFKAAIEALPFEANIAPLSAIALRERSSQKSYALTESGIAIIPIEGMLMKKSSWMSSWSGMCTYEDIDAQMEEAANDASVRAILLDIDSPGGETHGCFELTNKIYQMRASGKLIYGAANDLASSAAYCLLSSCDRAFVTMTGAVGSVGVYALHVSQKQLDQKLGLVYTYISAGEKKVDGNPHESLSDSAYQNIKSEIDRQYGIFVSTVARNRGAKSAAVVDTKAMCFFAENAIPLLADEVGTVEDALSALEADMNGAGASRKAGKVGSSASNTNSNSSSAAGAPVATNTDKENPNMPQPNATLSAEDQEKLKAAQAEVARITALGTAPAPVAATSAPVPVPAAAAPVPAALAPAPAPAPAAAAPTTDDDEEDEEDMDTTDPKAAAAATAAAAAAAAAKAAIDANATGKKRTPAVIIAEACQLAGYPALTGQFILDQAAGKITLADVRKQLLDKRAAASNENPTSSSHSAGANGAPLDRLEQMASTLVTNSGGRLTKSQAYEKVLLANPTVYEDYEDERADAIRGGHKAKRRYIQQIAGRFQQMGLGTQLTSITDNNLPR